MELRGKTFLRFFYTFQMKKKTNVPGNFGSAADQRMKIVMQGRSARKCGPGFHNYSKGITVLEDALPPFVFSSKLDILL
jgi:hypothetical protein